MQKFVDSIMRNVQQSIEKSIEADRQMQRDNPAYKIPEYSLLNPRHEINQKWTSI